MELGNIGEGPAQRVLAVGWALFTAAYLVFFYVFQGAAEIADQSVNGYLEVLLLSAPSVVLLAGVMWLSEAEVDPDLREHLIGWVAGAVIAFSVTVYTTLFVLEAAFDPGEQWLILLLTVGLGASTGTIMGILEIRAKQRERERNRSRQRAREQRRKRSQLEYLNQYLRHEVLNEANKISGYATLVTDNGTLDADTRRHVETIRESSEDIAAFIESIRTILEVSDHAPELETVDIVSTLEEEARVLDHAYPSATVDIDAPAKAEALAGGLHNRVFRNLLENAIDHNEAPLAIGVDVRVDAEWVAVEVRDDGSGIPPAERETLFEPPESGDHGYGLFLTKNLVEVYGGRLDLATTGPEGTTFVVRFRAASATEVPEVDAGTVGRASP